MSRLSRYTQQIFGSTATSNQIAEYGSLAAGVPARYSGSTITPAIVQNLSQYLSGWFSATEGAFSPAIEDMNALCYLYAYQLAYSFQIGIPEWDSATTYYIGGIVQDGAGNIYVSTTNSNTNNAFTDGSVWGAPAFTGSVVPNTVPYTSGTFNLTANTSMMWPYMNIGSGTNVVVPNAQLISIGAIVISGTGTLKATGTGIIKVFS